MLDLGAAGYVEEEFLVRRTAVSYAQDGGWDPDGAWNTTTATSAPYVTRVLVRRPTEAARFNGTVVVEWLNVSSGVDIDVDFGYLGPELVGGGYAWAGVSAQAVGVHGTGGQFGADAVGLRAWDPARYGELDHPGDAFAYDIFSQVGAVLRAPGPPLGGFDVEHLIADGESQSALRMLTYVNAVHPHARVYDGFLIHSRNGAGAPLQEGLMGTAAVPARVRTDLDTPVLQFQTETDLFGLGDEPGTDFPSARQPDADGVVTWEVAGTAHADSHYLRILLEQGQRQFSSFLDLGTAIPMANDGPQAEVMRAALHALHEWVCNGTPPPTSDPLAVADGTIVRDDDGIARGGVRTPAVDVPVAVLSGEGMALIGSTTRFSAEELAARYPDHDRYVAAVERSAQAAAEAGFLRPADADALVEAARSSEVGRSAPLQ